MAVSVKDVGFFVVIPEGNLRLFLPLPVFGSIKLSEMEAMMSEDQYTYRAAWLREDAEYAGLCDEFPSLSYLAPTPEAALSGIRGVTEQVVIDMRLSNEPLPQAIAG